MANDCIAFWYQGLDSKVTRRLTDLRLGLLGLVDDAVRVQIEGSRGAEIIAELAPQAGDRVIRKWRPSAFFRTDLEVFLGALRIDTLLCCGTSVSGCVRATVTDAFMRDIRCMVIRECVADRTEAVLEANLFDLHQKYAEVTSLSEVLTYLGSLSVQRVAVPA
jgi:nicotinamidase-related amidase